MVVKRNDPNHPLKVLLEAKELKKTFRIFKNFWFETKVAVDGVSLRVHEGEIVGILGPNGAGKSTSLKMISGDLVPNSGAVYFDGQDVTEWPMYKRCNNGLGYMAQDNTLFKQMSVENNLLGVMQMQGMAKQEARHRCEELLEMFDLARLRNNVAARLSGGEKRRLEVARALTKRPKMLILDEPFAGVDPKVIQTVRKLVLELRQKWGIAILITDHNVPNIVELVEWCYLIAGGKVLFEGPPEELLVDSAAREFYLGDGSYGQIATTQNAGIFHVNHNNFDESASQTQTVPMQNDANDGQFQGMNFQSSENQQNTKQESVGTYQSVQSDNVSNNSYDNYDSGLSQRMNVEYPSQTRTMDSVLQSSVLQPESEYSQSEYMDDYQSEGKSEKLASFIPRPDMETRPDMEKVDNKNESNIENDNLNTEQSEQIYNQTNIQNENSVLSTPIQPKRKNSPASPVIKPFRRKN